MDVERLAQLIVKAEQGRRTPHWPEIRLVYIGADGREPVTVQVIQMGKPTRIEPNPRAGQLAEGVSLANLGAAPPARGVTLPEVLTPALDEAPGERDRLVLEARKAVRKAFPDVDEDEEVRR